MPGERACEMQTTPWYLLDLITGFDEETDETEEESEEEEAEEEENDDEEEEESESSDDKAKKGKPTEAEALREALRKERKDRREAQKKARELEREKKTRDGKEKSAEEREAAAEAKSERLATKLRDTAVDNTITKLAAKFKFRDLDDALRLIDRDDVEVDQDEEDPADISVDEDSVETALKQLVEKKPHLLIGEGDGEESGGRFNGKKKAKDGLTDEVLRERYSALRRS